MVLKDNLDLLERIIYDLSNENIELVLTAGTNLALQGINVPVNDLDLITDLKGIEAFSKRYRSKEVTPMHYKESETIRSYFSVYNFNGLTVELMALCEIKNPTNGKWTFYSNGPREEFVHNKTKLQALSLESELKFYIGLGRNEKAKLIQQKIEENWGFFPGVH